MKLTIAFASTLAALTSANFLDKNTPCGDNHECAQDCQDGRYHVVIELFRPAQFGCSLDPHILYANPSCSFGLGDGSAETAKARETCDTVAGTLCRHTYRSAPKFVNNCVMVEKDSTVFQTNCEAAGGTFRKQSDGLEYRVLTETCERIPS